MKTWHRLWAWYFQRKWRRTAKSKPLKPLDPIRMRWFNAWQYHESYLEKTPSEQVTEERANEILRRVFNFIETGKP